MITSKLETNESYIASEDLMASVNIAMTLEKPLLVKGEPGTGKTMLAHAIADALATADPIHADAYAARAAAYTEELKALDDAYAATIAAAPVKTLLCGDRFPFRYLVDDYGLDYYAAFVGCSAETEADFETIAFLADKVDELGLHSILRIETSDGAIADTIKAATKDKDQQILTLDSLQGTVPTAGISYLTLMEENLATLEKALR